MKALELRTFELWDNGLDGTIYADIPGKQWPTPVQFVILVKRLTDAELAAEYHQSYAEYLAFSHRDHREWAIGDTLHRFATHPHYDEAV